MKLLQSVAQLAARTYDDFRQKSAEDHARDTIARATPSGWLIDFHNGRVFVDSETLMRINLANGYTVTPVYAGEPL